MTLNILAKRKNSDDGRLPLRTQEERTGMVEGDNKWLTNVYGRGHSLGKCPIKNASTGSSSQPGWLVVRVLCAIGRPPFIRSLPISQWARQVRAPPIPFYYALFSFLLEAIPNSFIEGFFIEKLWSFVRNHFYLFLVHIVKNVWNLKRLNLEWCAKSSILKMNFAYIRHSKFTRFIYHFTAFWNIFWRQI